jgi:hypothetical protein
LLTSEFEPFVPWKLWAIVLAFQKKKNQSSFGLLELKIWAEYRIVSELQDIFRLLRCSEFSVVAKIWTWKRHNWVLDSHESFRSMC